MKRLFSRLGPVVLLTLSAAARSESSVNVTIPPSGCRRRTGRSPSNRRTDP